MLRFFFRKKQAWSGRESDNLDQVKFRCTRETNYSRIAAAAVARGHRFSALVFGTAGMPRSAPLSLVFLQKLFVPSNCKSELTLLPVSSLKPSPVLATKVLVRDGKDQHYFLKKKDMSSHLTNDNWTLLLLQKRALTFLVLLVATFFSVPFGILSRLSETPWKGPAFIQ